MAIYQARFNRYLEDRGLKPTSDAKVWAFLGDGETDEPESLGAITLAAREKLDNLIFVINCNLQRLDGPVRGNGQIIQELEAAFRGAGWNVIKVIWGSEWDPLLAKDRDGLLVKRMGEIVDGEYQKYTVESGAYVREHFFGADPRLLEMVKHLSDEQLKKLHARRPRSGQGLRRLQGGRRAQGRADGDPGADDQGLRPGRSGRRQEHHAPAEEDERRRAARRSARASAFRSRRRRVHARRRSTARPRTAPRSGTCASGARRSAATCRSGTCARSRSWPDHDELFEEFLQGQRRPRGVDDDGVRAAAVEAAADKEIGKLIVPIVPDEARTFGMEALFRRSASTRTSARCTSRSTWTRCSITRKRRTGRFSRKASPRRLDVVVHRRRHGLRDARHEHDSVLHLLLDVRLPADRRSDLGGGRLAHARVPARRHRRPDDAGRRRAAASGRQQPPARAFGAEPAGLRPGVRLRDRGDHRRTASGGCTRTARTSSTTSR